MALLGAAAMTASTLADFTGIESIRIEDDTTQIENMFVCQLYANFDDPNDRLLSIGFADIAASTGSFYHHSMGLDTAPLDFLIEIFPVMLHDSFVTIGVTESDGSDATTPDPDFDSAAFNGSGILNGGWFNSNPDNGQGDPVDGGVIIAQLTIQDFSSDDFIGGSLTIFWKDGDTGEIIGTETSFDHPVPAPGAIVMLAAAGVVNRRRRRLR